MCYDLLIYAFSLGTFGFLVASVLTMPGEVLAWWPGLVQRVTRTRKKSPGDWNGLQWFFTKILYDCPKCIAGQLAVWLSLILCQDMGSAFVFVTLSIFSAFAIEKYYG